jgi:hypothetical protein
MFEKKTSQNGFFQIFTKKTNNKKTKKLIYKFFICLFSISWHPLEPLLAVGWSSGSVIFVDPFDKKGVWLDLLVTLIYFSENQSTKLKDYSWVTFPSYYGATMDSFCLSWTWFHYIIIIYK